MLAVGCMIPFVMLALGAGVGSYFGDINGGYLGAGVGFAGGLVIAVIVVVVLNRVRTEKVE